jgi:septal ring factor EnvC (AmiA/AmiB activator)
VFPGRVDYSGWFKGYGQLMVINHGERYFTLFAHLHKRVREKGEMISEGEPVGIAGDPGWNLGPGVYFEIRRGEEHLDPEKWLQVK